MKLLFEDRKWYLATDDQKALFRKAIAAILNEDQEDPIYTVSNNIGNINQFAPIPLRQDPRFPEYAKSIPFEIKVSRETGTDGTIILYRISNKILAYNLQFSLRKIGFKDIFIGSSPETIRKIAKFFGN